MKNRQLIVIITLLLTATIFVFTQKDIISTSKSISLNEALNNVQDYKLLGDTVTENWVIDTLRLDDVSQKKFVKGGERIDLYVGYYLSIDKLSAAHSPLVCIPGNGWVLDDLMEKEHSFNGYQLKYAEVTAEKNQSQSLIVYWFQAYDKSAPNMYINIYHALVNLMTGEPPETAFIRTIVPIREGDRVKARETALDFVERFYPAFMDYVNDRQQ